MPLKYESKRHLWIKLPSGEERELFLRGNMAISEVLRMLGFNPEEYCLVLSQKTLEAGKMLKDYENIETGVLKLWPL